jgi:Zn-dependent M28 family amino/carboxypeptidase
MNGAIPAIAGRIVAGDEQRYGTEVMVDELEARHPALILLLGRTRSFPPLEPILEEADAMRAPVVQVRDTEAAALLREDRELALTLHAAAPVLNEVPLRNVAAILRGSDPVLREQYVVLSAHYDHIGQNATGIFHGANDNASGTASVIEIAEALAALHPHPKRSILFLTFFGEEKGLLGSYYYTHHPLVPLKNTVADVNLEQMGRTDDVTGRKVGGFVFTGPSYSNLPAIVSGAAKLEGVNTYKRPDADDYFDRSDNYAFARQGVVAHTIAVTVEFPGYHALGDTLDKIDYANMAKVDRGVAAGIVELADEPAPPKWSDTKAAAPYRDGAGRN